MGDHSAIEWTEATWNPIVGCSRVSEGCRHCYAERHAFRAEAMGIPQYEGMTHKVGSEIRWTGKVALVETALELPLHWKKPRRIFVNSMSDLFHPEVRGEWIWSIFDVMLRARQHTYQVLTKRPERMRDCLLALQKAGRFEPWPHIWLGVSVEDQATAAERIPLLLQTPAAVRWVSYEPGLGPVDFKWWAKPRYYEMGVAGKDPIPALDWIVVGGESGPGARPFDLAWARQTIAQGRLAGVPVFCKQMGAKPIDSALRDVMCNGQRHYTKPVGDPFIADCEMRISDGRASGYSIAPHRFTTLDRKGGEPAEWPQDLRVREFPR